MLNLPNVGQRVYVWPHPGLKVQDGALAISDGGRWLAPGGRTVIWDEYRHRQFLAGELHLTDPRPAAKVVLATTTRATVPATASAAPSTTPAISGAATVPTPAREATAPSAGTVPLARAVAAPTAAPAAPTAEPPVPSAGPAAPAATAAAAARVVAPTGKE